MTLNKRFKAVLKWCDVRSINQIVAFFKGCDPAITQYYARIGYVLRNSSASLSDEDVPWIESMEATIAALNNRKAAA